MAAQQQYIVGVDTGGTFYSRRQLRALNLPSILVAIEGLWK